jgi:hypothetical protein
MEEIKGTVIYSGVQIIKILGLILQDLSKSQCSCPAVSLSEDIERLSAEY